MSEGMGFIELWSRFQAKERRDKIVKLALESTSTDALTKAWDHWDCVSEMLPAEPKVSELDIYCELRKRGVDRCWC